MEERDCNDCLRLGASDKYCYPPGSTCAVGCQYYIERSPWYKALLCLFFGCSLEEERKPMYDVKLNPIVSVTVFCKRCGKVKKEYYEEEAKKEG